MHPGGFSEYLRTRLGNANNSLFMQADRRSLATILPPDKLQKHFKPHPPGRQLPWTLLNGHLSSVSNSLPAASQTRRCATKKPWGWRRTMPSPCGCNFMREALIGG